MNELEEFVNIFRAELIDSELNSSSHFKHHKNWSSLTSLIIITEIEAEFGVFVEIDALSKADTIEDLFSSAVSVAPK